MCCFRLRAAKKPSQCQASLEQQIRKVFVENSIDEGTIPKERTFRCPEVPEAAAVQ